MQCLSVAERGAGRAKGPRARRSVIRERHGAKVTRPAGHSRPLIPGPRHDTTLRRAGCRPGRPCRQDLIAKMPLAPVVKPQVSSGARSLCCGAPRPKSCRQPKPCSKLYPNRRSPNRRERPQGPPSISLSTLSSRTACNSTFSSHIIARARAGRRQIVGDGAFCCATEACPSKHALYLAGGRPPLPSASSDRCIARALGTAARDVA